MDKHTPGPWRIVRTSDYTGEADDTEIQSVSAMGGETILYTDGGYFEPREADARLIAAAPDLLEALYALLSADSKEPADVTAHRLNVDLRVVAKARRAIAKAEGRKSEPKWTSPPPSPELLAINETFGCYDEEKLRACLSDMRDIMHTYHKGEAPGHLDACENPDCCGHCIVMRQARELLGPSQNDIVNGLNQEEHHA